jgi:transcriptional antiterminator RfaH
MDGVRPARVADQIIDDLRKRERNGLIELPRLKLRPGDRVRLLRGPFAGHLAIFADMKPRERVEVLLTFLAAQQRVTLSQDDVERVQY